MGVEKVRREVVTMYRVMSHGHASVTRGKLKSSQRIERRVLSVQNGTQSNEFENNWMDIC